MIMAGVALAALGIVALVEQVTPSGASEWWVLVAVGVAMFLTVPGIYCLARNVERIVREDGAKDGDARPSGPVVATQPPAAAEINATAIVASWPWRLLAAETQPAVLVSLRFCEDDADTDFSGGDPAKFAVRFNHLAERLEALASGFGGAVARMDAGEALLLFLGGTEPGEGHAQAAPALRATRAALSAVALGDAADAAFPRIAAGIGAGSVGVGVMTRGSASHPVIFGELVRQVRLVMDAAERRNLNLIVTTDIEAALAGTFRLTPLGALPELAAYPGLHGFAVQAPHRGAS